MAFECLKFWKKEDKEDPVDWKKRPVSIEKHSGDLKFLKDTFSKINITEVSKKEVDTGKGKKKVTYQFKGRSSSCYWQEFEINIEEKTLNKIRKVIGN